MPPPLPLDTLLIDFGNNISPAPWNNVGDPVAGHINDLVNSAGFSSGRGIVVFDPFNNINTNGTQSPDPAIGFPPTATGDSFFGNIATFGGQEQPTGGVELFNLVADKLYTISIFASRDATDNRETQYVVEGLTTDTLYLDAAANASEVAITSLQPAADGTIRVTASPGPNNNNASGFYYLGAMKIVYDHEEPSTPAMLDLVSPNGGEIWQVGKTPSIIWESRNILDVTLEYSTDNGSSWTTIATVPAIQQKYPWMVPDELSQECLIRVLSDTLVDLIQSVFEITTDTTTCRIVVLGSSTAEGAGASSPDSAWVNRYNRTVFQKNTRYEVINLGRGGYTTYHILPTGTTIPTGVGITIDQTRNVTKALSLDPFAIIINMPSNDAANNFTVSAQLANFALMVATAKSNGVEVWPCTTQPRNFANQTQIQIQTEVRDSILAIYGDHAIDFWTGLADPDGSILDEYDSGDGVHVNNAGHRLLFEKVLAKELDTIDCNAVVGTVEWPQPETGHIRVFPNPFNDWITVEVETMSAGVIELRLTDVFGRQVGFFEENVSGAGIHQFQVSANQLLGQGKQMLYALVSIQDARGFVQKGFTMVNME